MKEFIDYLNNLDARYYVDTEGGVEKIYIFAKKDYDLVHKHPRKYKNRYVPYIRVSHFEGNRVYVRDNGLCEYRSLDVLKKKIEKEYL